MKMAEWGVLRWVGVIALVLASGFCVASFYGMGGWSQALPLAPPSGLALSKDDAPHKVPTKSAESVFIAQYSLFSPQRGPDMQSFSTPKIDDANAISQDWQLISMMITPSLTVAVMVSSAQQVVRVRLGDTLPGGQWSFSRAEPRAAILTGNSGEQRIELRTYTGQPGGAVNSPMTSNIPMTTTPATVGQPPVNPSIPFTAPNPEIPGLSPEQALRQRLEQRRSELQQQDNQGSNPL